MAHVCDVLLCSLTPQCSTHLDFIFHNYRFPSDPFYNRKESRILIVLLSCGSDRDRDVYRLLYGTLTTKLTNKSDRRSHDWPPQGDVELRFPKS